MKYFFVADIDAKRQLWYLYYFPMLFIPLLSFFVALSLGKTEKYRLPRRALLLCIPTVCLLLFVLTNDFHEWIFRFPEGQPRSDANGVYSIGFLFVAGWEIIFAVAALVLLLAKAGFVEKKIPACNNTDMFGCVCGSVCKRYTLDAGRRRRSDGGTMPFCGDIA